jgi:hypothetical protein
MMSVDAAFDRIGSALQQRGYSRMKEETPSPGFRVASYSSQDMAVRVRWNEKSRVLALEVEANGEWAEFARRAFGPQGLEDTAVEALVRAVRNEVAETSTDAD